MAISMHASSAPGLTQRTRPGHVDLPDEDPSSSISKVLTILETFQEFDSAIGVTQVARQAELSKSTTFRLLRTLVRHGYVERCNANYRLTNRLFELGQHVWPCQPNSVRDVAVPHLMELAAQAPGVVHLAVLDRIDVLYLEKLYRHPMRICPTQVGGRMSARSTALGKVLLAHSSDDVVDQALRSAPTLRTRYTKMVPDLVRTEIAAAASEGVAYDREEVRLGLTCVAAPIICNGKAVAAVSLSCDTSAGDPARAANRVRTTAMAIARSLPPDRG